MSMTREEIIKEYENAVVASGLAAAAGNEDAAKSYELFKAGLSALRPFSREQVEKVWRGCNNCRTCDSCAYRYIKAEEEPCWSCNTNIYSNYKPEPNRKFCPACGAPMTDEAVEIMLKRMEALLND